MLTYESVWYWIKNTRRPWSFRNMFDFVQPTKTQRWKERESVNHCRQLRRDNAKWKSSEVMRAVQVTRSVWEIHFCVRGTFRTERNDTHSLNVMSALCNTIARHTDRKYLTSACFFFFFLTWQVHRVECSHKNGRQSLEYWWTRPSGLVHGVIFPLDL